MIESWVDLPEWPNYQVSSLGRVKRLACTNKLGNRRLRERILPLRKWVDHQNHSRLYVCLGGLADRTNRCVGRLVLLAFVGPPLPGQECRHLDDDHENCTLNNLKWGTHLENIHDAMRNGKTPRGESSGRSKLTEVQVLEIRRLYKAHSKDNSGPALGKRYGVTAPVITSIVRREIWKHVP